MVSRSFLSVLRPLFFSFFNARSSLVYSHLCKAVLVLRNHLSIAQSEAPSGAVLPKPNKVPIVIGLKKCLFNEKELITLNFVVVAGR